MSVTAWYVDVVYSSHPAEVTVVMWKRFSLTLHCRVFNRLNDIIIKKIENK